LVLQYTVSKRLKANVDHSIFKQKYCVERIGAFQHGLFLISNANEVTFEMFCVLVAAHIKWFLVKGKPTIYPRLMMEVG
jgi:hypothetical protein